METLCLCCSFLFILFLHPNVAYFPLNVDSHKPPKCVLPKAYRSSGTSPLWVLFTRCNSSGADCSSMDTPQERFHDKNLLFMAYFPWAKVPTRSLLQGGFSMGSQGIYTYCCVGSFMVSRLGVCSSSVLHTLQDNLCSGIWSTLQLPNFFSDVCVCRAACSVMYSYSSLTDVAVFFYPFLSVITEVLQDH